MEFDEWWRKAEIFAGEGSMEAAEQAWDAAIEHQNEGLVTMVKVFKACIETGVYPIKDSPCYDKINELIGGDK